MFPGFIDGFGGARLFDLCAYWEVTSGWIRDKELLLGIAEF